MIQINALDLQRSGKPLFEQASLTIHPGQRFALVGDNGCGKSSLFQVLLGTLGYDGGDVAIPPKWQIAHMAQEIEALDRTALEYVLDGHTELRSIEQALKVAEEASDDAEIVRLHAAMDALDGYNMHYVAETILQGLGFSSTDFSRAVSRFSGGWRIRLNLARALLAPGDLLLLDEPTNHLDLEAIVWLEQWVQRFDGAVLLISHDRDFIDHTVDHIVHVDACKLRTYSGTYSAFERQRAERISQQQALWVKQQEKAAHLQKFVDRFRAKASKAKQAQSRLKALEKMPMIAAIRQAQGIEIRIPCAEKTGSPLINWFQVAIGYQKNQPVLTQCTFSILPQMRIGLLGANGAGKSTLMKTLVGELSVLQGEAVASDHLAIGYFAQHQLEALDLSASPVVHLQRLDATVSEQEIRDFLGRFMIKGDMATGSIRHFSGGEKARLALAIVAFKKPNLLILDEPTNHLDISLREALADALLAFEGAVVLVSHDRYLLRHCVDEFWLVDQGKITPFSGDLEDYHKLKVTEEKKEAAPVVKTADKKSQRQQAAKARQALTPVTRKIRKIEADLEKAQSRLADVRSQLSDQTLYEESNKILMQRVLSEESTLKQTVEMLEAEWFDLEEELQSLQAGQ